jgi:hypothetical protein
MRVSGLYAVLTPSSYLLEFTGEERVFQATRTPWGFVFLLFLHQRLKDLYL